MGLLGLGIGIVALVWLAIIFPWLWLVYVLLFVLAGAKS